MGKIKTTWTTKLPQNMQQPNSTGSSKLDRQESWVYRSPWPEPGAAGAGWACSSAGCSTCSCWCRGFSRCGFIPHCQQMESPAPSPQKISSPPPSMAFHDNHRSCFCICRRGGDLLGRRHGVRLHLCHQRGKFLVCTLFGALTSSLLCAVTRWFFCLSTAGD